LYCHPQDLVGWARKDKVEEIAHALRKGATFKLYRVDTYEEAYNYTVEELKAALPERKEALEALLLERFRTPRRNLYKFPNLDIRTGLSYFAHRGELRQVESLFIQSTFEELVACGKIARAEKDGSPIYRTAVPLSGSGNRKRKPSSDPAGSEPLFGEKKEEVHECRV
jgi:hypothetical protein